ncbi:aminotransferase class I/II-fold pyridoxal phosphate-dependent enzyme [Cytobacillus sp. FSL W7-1323]|uniref:threonine aldolase family protein n=1 Tax=Cytobacillus TaxID=2675230 RepID=UPI00203AB261|nr:aminotransferase class I/II-fold pyridoxal phosphate-dependent enzyme [Cytobacillus kochii]MCM3323760.1 aminotransferase class I/II-fold pyridoxal phosphate-dependent enzyme [Cytobacillus kochii]MCM3346059.1 aminotransferase class I/II-fold pyridoxal phosphate-dependent enzyme [Cytobacillus kochii]
MTLLQDIYQKSLYTLSGHGVRQVEVLKEAFRHVQEDVTSDIYGEGQIIAEFEKKMATLLGKEKAVFFPSGTMAQQIALRIWSDKKQSKKIAYHPLSHLEIHEQDGPQMLHQFDVTFVSEESRPVGYEEISHLDDSFAALLLELPQREIGGSVPPFSELLQMADHCRENNIKLHLDGARLLEVLPYYEKSAEEVSALFDSVYLSFYKGVGGIAGAILAGDKSLIEEAKVWKRRFGGDLISLYPYIIPADYYYEKRKDKMKRYYEISRFFAERFNQITGLHTKPKVPQSNMFHLYFEKDIEDIEQLLKMVYEECGVGITSRIQEKDNEYFAEISFGDAVTVIPETVIEKMFLTIKQNI